MASKPKYSYEPTVYVEDGIGCLQTAGSKPSNVFYNNGGPFVNIRGKKGSVFQTIWGPAHFDKVEE
jgi:hypothetical protein